MRRESLLVALLCLLITGTAVAEPSELGVSLDWSYWTKWLTKGAEGYRKFDICPSRFSTNNNGSFCIHEERHHICHLKHEV